MRILARLILEEVSSIQMEYEYGTNPEEVQAPILWNTRLASSKKWENFHFILELEN